MKRHSYIVITTLFLFISLPTLAQHVESGSSIISCRTVPFGARRPAKEVFDPYHFENDPSNLLPHKFEVAKENAATTMNWESARSACNNKGNGWRLPTQKEMNVIVMLHDELLSQPGFSPIKNINTTSAEQWYWTGTLVYNNSNDAWATDFKNNGRVYYKGQNEIFFVRCVREVTDPTIQ